MTTPRQGTKRSDRTAWTDLSCRVDASRDGSFEDTATQSAVCVCTLDGTITDATQSFGNCFEDDSQQPVGSSLEQWLSTADGIVDVEQLYDQLRAGETVRRELSVGSPDEQTIVAFEASPIDVDGQSLIVAVCRDVTAQRRAEQQEALLAEVSCAIGRADCFEQGLKRTLNTICSYTEWTYGEVWTPADRSDELTYAGGYTDDPALERFQTESTSVSFAFGEGLPGRVYAAQSPEWIPDVSEQPSEVFYRSAVATDCGVRAALGVPVVAGETVVAVLAFFLTERRAVDEPLVADVSAVADRLSGLVERKQAEELLRRRNKHLEEFAAVVSHDLRNPLNVATGALEMLKDDTESEYVETVAAAHERMNELIEDILVLAKQGKTVGSPEPIVLAEAVQTCWKTVETPEATLAVDTDRVIRADRSRLRQIVENLLRNAVIHGDTETTVQVDDLETGFYIADDGPGIPAAERETVFDPGHTTHTDGNGLGLAIVRDIVTAHGWQIRVTESASGGARFEITGVDCVD